MTINNLLEELNPAQRKAATTKQKPKYTGISRSGQW